MSGVTVNNGVNYYTRDIPNDDEIFNDNLTISTRGEYSGTVTYHEGNFLLANNILVMTMPGLSKNQKLFIGSIINNLNYGGYDNYPRAETLKNDVVELPINNDGSVNYNFMDSFVAELEALRVAELEAYLKVTGLKDYNLTKEEEQALKDYDKIEYINFDVTKIFEVKNTHNILSTEIKNYNGSVPYLCASADNNSVNSYVEHNLNLLDKGNCIFIGGKTFVVSYQKVDFFSNDSHNLALYYKENITENEQLFLATCVRKSLSHKYSWGNSISKTKIKNEMIALPVFGDESNIEFSNNLINAIKKLVIKDVVKYADEKISATKLITK